MKAEGAVTAFDLLHTVVRLTRKLEALDAETNWSNFTVETHDYDAETEKKMLEAAKLIVAEQIAARIESAKQALAALGIEGVDAHVAERIRDDKAFEAKLAAERAAQGTSITVTTTHNA